MLEVKLVSCKVSNMPPPKTRNSKLNEQDEIHEEVENDEPEDIESDEIDREIQELEREEQRLTNWKVTSVTAESGEFEAEAIAQTRRCLSRRC